MLSIPSSRIVMESTNSTAMLVARNRKILFMAAASSMGGNAH
jgi:hypothetical protein